MQGSFSGKDNSSYFLIVSFSLRFRCFGFLYKNSFFIVLNIMVPFTVLALHLEMRVIYDFFSSEIYN